MASDLESKGNNDVAVKTVVVVGVAILALFVANFLFSLVLTLIKSAVFLAILAGVVWFGYKLIASSDSPKT